MSMWVGKLLPYAGWPLAALMVFFYLGVRDDLAGQISLCNEQKLEMVANAERATREALQAANARHIEEVEAVRQRGAEGVRLAQMGRSDAESERDEAQARLRQIMREAREDEDATISQVCLDVSISDDALNSLR